MTSGFISDLRPGMVYRRVSQHSWRLVLAMKIEDGYSDILVLNGGDVYWWFYHDSTPIYIFDDQTR